MVLDAAFEVTPSLIGDIVLIAIVLIFAFIAAYKGFFRCLIGFVGTVLSIVLAFIFCRTMANSLQNWFGLLDTFTKGFTDLISKIPAFAVPIENNVEASLSAANVPAFVVKLIVEALAGESVVAGTTPAQLIAPVVANMALLVLSFFGIFLVIKIICIILNKTFGEAIRNIPGVRSLNSLLGFILGAAEGLFFVYCLLFLAALFPIQAVTDFITQTTVMNYLYNNNLLGYLINWIISTDWLKDSIKQLTELVTGQ